MNKFLSLISGKCVGKDNYGNSYYESRWVSKNGKQRRWVDYKSKTTDPSNVPAEWHGWLHSTDEITPNKLTINKFFWQTSHMANGIIKFDQKNKRDFKDYSSWNPKN